jgi:hypothetical protein
VSAKRKILHSTVVSPSGMSFRARSAAFLVAIAAVCCLPGGAAAASSGSFDDPIGDSLEFAPDLGTTTVTIGDDETITVDTRFVARPPAGWGGCAYYVAGICIPADMTLTWYIDHTASSGSLADGGADAKVVAIPRREMTTWEGSRWDAANGKFAAGAPPVASDDANGARWTLRLADLGIPRPSTVRIWAVSLYKSYNGLGALFNYEDTAGPGTVSVDGPSASAPTAASGPCKRKAKTVNAIQRRIRALRRQAANGNRRAGRKLRRLRETRGRAVRAMKRRCGPPMEQAEPPSAAPPGCKLVTKPVLQQEGIGIHAEWVVKPEVVVECSK